MNRICRLLSGLLLVLVTVPVEPTAAQSSPSEPPATIEADPADVESLDAITTAVYDVISGEAGEPRDWDRFRSLFAPEARLIPTRVHPTEGNRTMPMTVDQYAERADGWFKESGFYEKELYRKVEQFGPMAHYFSTYESFRSTSDEEPFMRGINSIQALHDGSRWWIVNIYWVAETEALPIPEQYLPEAG